LFLNAAAAAAQSPSNTALPIGTPATTAITFGDAYASAVDWYEVKMTVLEVVRGDKALQRVKTASEANPAPPAGFEYLLARVKFEFSSKDAPGNRNYVVRENQFLAVSNGTEYENAVLAQLKPALNGPVYAGDALEGWIAFLIKLTDKPALTFKGAFSHSTGVWLQLYSD
jgi:hypothetical protein